MRPHESITLKDVSALTEQLNGLVDEWPSDTTESSELDERIWHILNTVVAARNVGESETKDILRFLQSVLSLHRIRNVPITVVRCWRFLLEPNHEFYKHCDSRVLNRLDEEDETKDWCTCDSLTPGAIWILGKFCASGGFLKALELSKQKDASYDLMSELTLLADSVAPSLSDTALRDYGLEVIGTLYSGILALPDKEFKKVTPQSIRKELCPSTLFHELSSLRLQSEANQIFLRFNIDYLIRCLRCPYLDKRLHGITELLKHLQERRCNMMVFEVLKRESLVSLLFGDGLQAAVVRSSIPVLQFLANSEILGEEDMRLIWDAARNRHSTDQVVVLEALGAIVLTVVGDRHVPAPANVIQTFYSLIREHPLHLYNLHLLQVVTNIAVAAVLRKLQLETECREPLGLDILWDLMQDGSTAEHIVQIQALAGMFDAISMDHTERLSVLYASKCVKCVQRGESSTTCIRLLKQLVDRGRDQRASMCDETGFVGTRNVLLEQLDSEFDLIELLLADLIRFQEKCRTQPTNYEACADALRIRLDLFQTFLLSPCFNLKMNQVDVLWDCIITNASSPAVRDVGFVWLQDCADGRNPALSDEISQYIFLKKVDTLDFSGLTEAGFQFFEYFFRSVNWKNNTFAQIDTSEARGQPSSYFVLSFDLIGMDYLWRIILEAESAKVASDATQTFIRVHENFQPRLRSRLGEKREESISVCLEHLTSAASSLEQFDDPTQRRRVSRCLELLKRFIEDAESRLSPSRRKRRHSDARSISITVRLMQGMPFTLSTTANASIASLRQQIGSHLQLSPDVVRIIFGGKELKDAQVASDYDIVDGVSVHVMLRGSAPATQSTPTSDIEVALTPTEILSRPERLDKLFSFLDHDGVTAREVWGLLMILPTNEQLLNRLSAASSADWDSIFPRSSKFRLLYSLHIVDMLMDDKIAKDVHVDSNEWRDKFVHGGGLRALLHVLMTVDISRQPLSNSLGSDAEKANMYALHQCILYILRILVTFLLDGTDSDGNCAEHGPHRELATRFTDAILRKECSQAISEVVACWLDAKFPRRMLDIIFMLSTAAEEEPLESSSPLTSALAGHTASMERLLCLQLAFGLILFVLSSTDGGTEMFVNYFDLSDWVEGVLLRCLDPTLRVASAVALEQLVAGPGIGSVVGDSLMAVMHGLYPVVVDQAQYYDRCEQYFEFYCRLLKHQCAAGNVGDKYRQLGLRVMKGLDERGSSETRYYRNEDRDPILIGGLKLLTALVLVDHDFAANVGSPTGSDYIRKLFCNYLFHARAVSQREGAGGADAVPRCLTDPSRQAAFGLLLALAQSGDENMSRVLSMLAEHHSLTDNITSWHYSPRSNLKADVGYVGLKNLGATCYMNSLIQQFFMIPDLRSSLLRARELSTEENESSFFSRVQVMFANLLCSERRYYDPTDLCMSYKIGGDTMNTAIQMDVNEFFTQFVDQIECALRGQPEEKIFLSAVGGKLCNQMVSKECPCVSEGDEPFYFLQTEVRNCDSIEESFDMLVAGDLLDGENKYQCDRCNRKVAAVKRTCISELPPTLMLHMKRFDFDYDTFKRIKLNSRCSFPLELNMEPYTKEGIARREGRAVDVGDRPPSYYKYELSGVLVHTGTSDSGHYYSFIKERQPRTTGGQCRWLQFNDSTVEEWNVSDLETQCFGGYDNAMNPTAGRHGGRHQRVASAYMLCYDRVKTDGTEDIEDVGAEVAHIPKDVYNAIRRDNLSLFVDLNLFDNSYFEFISRLVRTDRDALTPEKPFSAVDLEKVQLGTLFCFSVLVHSKDKPELMEWIEYLRAAFSIGERACRWLLSHVAENEKILSTLFLQCPLQEVRSMFQDIIVIAVRAYAPLEETLLESEPSSDSQGTPPQAATLIKSDILIMDDDADVGDSVRDMPEELDTVVVEEKASCHPSRTDLPVLGRLAEALLSLIPQIRSYQQGRFSAQFFMLIEEALKAAPAFRWALHNRQAISKIIAFYLGDDSSNARGPRKKKLRAMDRFSGINNFAQALFNALAALVCSLDLQRADEAGDELPPTQLEGIKCPAAEADAHELLSDRFLTKIVRDPSGENACREIVTHLCWNHRSNSSLVIQQLFLSGAKHAGDGLVRVVMTLLFDIEDALSHERRIEFARLLFNGMGNVADAEVLRTLFEILVKASGLTTEIRGMVAEESNVLVRCLLLVPAEVRPIIGKLLQSAVVGSADPSRMRSLHKQLLSLMDDHRAFTASAAAQYVHICYVSYFELLRACLLTQEDVLYVKKRYGVQIFDLLFSLPRNDRELDFDRSAIISYLHRAAHFDESVLQPAMDQPAKFLELPITVRAGDTERENFNRDCLVPFYEMVLACATKCPSFAEVLPYQHTWKWALTNLYFKYPGNKEVCAAMLPIVKFLVQGKSEYASKVLETAILSLPGQLPGSTREQRMDRDNRALDLIAWLLPSREISFCEFGGLDVLSQIIVSWDFALDEDVKVIEKAVRILNDAIMWFPDGGNITRLTREHTGVHVISKMAHREPLFQTLVQQVSTHMKDDAELVRVYRILRVLCGTSVQYWRTLLRWMLRAHEDLFPSYIVENDDYHLDLSEKLGSVRVASPLTKRGTSWRGGTSMEIDSSGNRGAHASEETSLDVSMLQIYYNHVLASAASVPSLQSTDYYSLIQILLYSLMETLTFRKIHERIALQLASCLADVAGMKNGEACISKVFTHMEQAVALYCECVLRGNHQQLLNSDSCLGVLSHLYPKAREHVEDLAPDVLLAWLFSHLRTTVSLFEEACDRADDLDEEAESRMLEIASSAQPLVRGIRFLLKSQEATGCPGLPTEDLNLLKVLHSKLLAHQSFADHPVVKALASVLELCVVASDVDMEEDGGQGSGDCPKDPCSSGSADEDGASNGSGSSGDDGGSGGKDSDCGGGEHGSTEHEANARSGESLNCDRDAACEADNGSGEKESSEGGEARVADEFAANRSPRP
eukprot:Rmarinus@m.24887